MDCKTTQKPASQIHRKIRVIIIPDRTAWILGTMSLEILKWNANCCDALIYPSDEIRANPTKFVELLSEFEIVHILSEYEYPEIKALAAQAADQRPFLISTVNHIISPETIAQCFTADRVMVVCEKYRREVISLGTAEDNVYRFRLGVDTDIFRPMDMAKCRARLGLPQDAFILGVSGNASTGEGDRKGMGFLGQILESLSHQWNGSVHIQTVGRGWQEFADKWGQQGVVVHSSGFIDSKLLPLHYNAVNVHLTTSTIEGGPVPLLEAMSCGTPIISTPVGTALDVIINETNGLMVDYGNVPGYATSIDRLRADAKFATNIGVAGRETIISGRQWKETALDAGCIYESFDLGSLQDRSPRMSSRQIAHLSRHLIASDRLRSEIAFKGRESLMNKFKRHSLDPCRVPKVIVSKLTGAFKHK